MKVKDLIEILKKYDKDLEVYAEWEGQHILVEEYKIAVEFLKNTEYDVLLINVDIDW